MRKKDGNEKHGGEDFYATHLKDISWCWSNLNSLRNDPVYRFANR